MYNEFNHNQQHEEEYIVTNMINITRIVHYSFIFTQYGLNGRSNLNITTMWICFDVIEDGHVKLNEHVINSSTKSKVHKCNNNSKLLQI